MKPETILKKAKAVSPTFYLYAEYMLDAFPTMNMPTLKDCFKHNTKLYPASVIAAARVQENERCVQALEALWHSNDDSTKKCIAAIRALINA